MLQMFLRPKPCAMMRMLRDSDGNWHISKLARGSGATFVYTSRLMARLQEKGLVTMESKGKRKIVRLTEEGIKVANAIEELANTLGPSDDAQ